MSKRILVVEDQEDNRQILRDLLGNAGYELIEAENGEEALAAVARQRPDLILMDIQLPGMNGIQALGHLRADPRTRDIPVMAVTASAMTHDRQKIMAAGFDAYQAKPINVKEFTEAVRRMLDRAPGGGATP